MVSAKNVACKFSDVLASLLVEARVGPLSIFLIACMHCAVWWQSRELGIFTEDTAISYRSCKRNDIVILLLPVLSCRQQFFKTETPLNVLWSIEHTSRIASQSVVRIPCKQNALAWYLCPPFPCERIRQAQMWRWAWISVPHAIEDDSESACIIEEQRVLS